jgi:hypothetical protein
MRPVSSGSKVSRCRSSSLEVLDPAEGAEVDTAARGALGAAAHELQLRVQQAEEPGVEAIVTAVEVLHQAAFEARRGAVLEELQRREHLAEVARRIVGDAVTQE